MTKIMNSFGAAILLGACHVQTAPQASPVQISEVTNSTDSAVPSPSRMQAQFIEIEGFESAYVKPRNISIWLPDGYLPGGDERYPVIYAHDGQNMFHFGHSGDSGKEWRLDETAARMMAEGAIRKSIIVGIWNTDKRYEEYAPQGVMERISGEAWSKEGAASPIEWAGDVYLKFIVEELKPYIDERYATRPDAQNTFSMGSSMGGLISLYAAAEYPDVFGRVAAVSIHWPLATPGGAVASEADTAMQAYLASSALDLEKQRLWFDNGTETLDAAYPPHAAAMQTWFRGQGWREHEAVFRTYEGTNHSETAWADRTDDILTFLLSD